MNTADGPQFEDWVERALDLKMDAEGIIDDRRERRTRFVWAQDIPVPDEYRDLEIQSGHRNAAEDGAIFDIRDDINEKMLREISYEALKEKHGDTETLYMVVIDFVGYAVRHALTYLGEYDVHEDSTVSMEMRVTRELYRRMQLPWRYDNSLPIPND